MAKYGQVPDATRSWAGLNAVPADVLIVRSNNGTLWRRTPGGQGSGSWQYQAQAGSVWRDAVPMSYEPGQQPFHEITFPALETPTRESVNVNVHGSSPDMAESLRRSAERVVAMHGGRGPQQYKTGGIKINTSGTVTSWAEPGDMQPITLHGVPGMYYAPEISGKEAHMICLTRLTNDGSAIYYRGHDQPVPEGLMTAGSAVEIPEHIRTRCKITVLPDGR